MSQGCRPVGQPLVVTRAERNVIYEIAGRPAARPAQRAGRPACRPMTASLLARGVHVGRVMDESADRLRPGRLPRPPGDRCRSGGEGRSPSATRSRSARPSSSTSATRTAPTRTCERCWPAHRAAPRCVFTCNGRGTHLFDEPHHDAGVVNAWLDGGATAGMFCAGELGPVGGRNFVHGFTASVLLFGEP